MQLTPVSFLIVFPMLFLAGFVDSIGGGGGLISLPAYLIADLPAHMAIATNKLSSSCGSALTTDRFRSGFVKRHENSTPDHSGRTGPSATEADF